MSCHRTIIRLSAVLAVVALTKGCGDGENPAAPPTPEPARPTTVTVSPATAELTALGAIVQLTAEVRNQHAGVMARAAVTWESGNTSVATVGTSGLLTAVGNGSTEITATAGPANGQARITVRQAPAAVVVEPDTALSFTRPGSVSIAPGGDIHLRATVKDQNGHPITGADLAWASADTTVVRVDSFGRVEALTLGSTEVTAAAALVTGRLLITVTHPAYFGTRSTGPFVLSSLGETRQLTAIPYDENGRDVVGAKTSWESGDPSVTTVDSLGLVTAVSNSRYTATSQGRVRTGITATSGPVAKYRWDIEVRQAVAEVVVSPAAVTIWGNGIVLLTAEPFDANGHVVHYEGRRVDGVPYTANVLFTWSSSNTAVAQVKERGLGNPHRVTGLAEGTATITATTYQGNVGWLGSGSGSAKITVAIPSPESRYPIHVNYLGEVPEDLRWGMEAAAATWGRILAPTEAAPFEFDQAWSGYGNIWSDMEAFEAGDVLAPGLHLYVVENSSRRGVWGWAGPAGASQLGTSDVPMDPVGVIALNGELFQEQKDVVMETQPHMADYFQQVHDIAMHEIAHVLGIGTSNRWLEWLRVPDPEKPWNAYFTDPEAIAVFDRMGGTDFPETTPKIPLTFDHAHWDGCAGHFDIIGSSRNPTSTVTELTMASLAEGYIYDPSMAPGRKLDPESWTSDFTGCRDGQYDPDFRSPAAEAPSPWAIGSFQGDVIGIPEW